jgi:hypothetical protein
MMSIRFNRSNDMLCLTGKLYQIVALLTAASLISGCTTSMTSVRDDSGPEIAAKGFRYHLPAREFKVEINWQLEGCEGVSLAEWTPHHQKLTAYNRKVGEFLADNPNKSVPDDLVAEMPLPPGPKLTFAADAKFEHEIVRGEAVTIDHMKMASAFKTSELKLTFFKKKIGGTDEEPIYASTGILQTFNATIEGKEAEALEAAIGLATNVAKGALTVAGSSVGGAVTANSVPPTLSKNPCRPETIQMMTDLADAETKIKELAVNIEGVDKKVLLLRKRIIDGVVTDSDRKSLEGLNADLDKYDAQLQALTNLHKNLNSYLSFSVTCVYAPTLLDTYRSCTVNSKDAIAWLSKLLLPELAGKVPNFIKGLETRLWVEPAGFDAANRNPNNVAANCKTVPATEESVANAKRLSIPAGRIDGFLYREASTTRFCMQRHDANDALPAKDRVIINEVIAIPQFGKPVIVRLKSGFGEKSSLSFTFGADGNPLEAGHVKATAGGTELLKALKGGSASILEVVELDAKLRKERAAARKASEKTEVQKIEDEIALLEAQQKLQRTRTQETSESAQLDAEIALLERRRDVAKLQQEIIELSKP